MKKALLFLLAGIFIVACRNDNKSLQILHSNNENIEYIINEKPPVKWIINPKLKPDRLKVECKDNGSQVTFFSDIDTILTNVKLYY